MSSLMRWLIPVLVFAPGVSAWDKSVHQLISRLSVVYFEEDTTTLVYLMAHLMETIKASQYTDDDTVNKIARALSTEADWADQQKGSAHLHFIHLPPGSCSPSSGPIEDLVCGTTRRPECLSTGVEDAFAVAMDPIAPSLARTNAIKHLLHVIADGLQPMHVALQSDLGGNTIILTSPSTTLHQLWDGPLFFDSIVSTFQLTGGEPVSIYALSQKLRDQVEEAREKYAFSDRQLETGDFIMDMLLETANDVTCPLAYNSDILGRIVSGTDLNSDDPDYIVSRGEVAVEQVIKAAVRIGQVFKYIAHAFRQNKRNQIAHRVPAPAAGPVMETETEIVDNNRFLVLSEDLDPTEDNHTADESSQCEDELGCIQSSIGSARTSRRKRAPRAVVQGVRLDELVIVRRHSELVIVTSRDRADWYRVSAVPRNMRAFQIQFGLSEDRPKKQIIVDLDAIPASVRLGQRFLLALFKFNKGVPDDDDADDDGTSENEVEWEHTHVAAADSFGDEAWPLRLVDGAQRRGITFSQGTREFDEETRTRESEAAALAQAVRLSGEDPLVVLYSSSLRSKLITRESLLCRSLEDSDYRIALNGVYTYSMDERDVPVQGMLFIEPSVWDYDYSSEFNALTARSIHDPVLFERVTRRAYEQQCDLTLVLQHLDQIVFDPVSPDPRVNLPVIHHIHFETRPGAPELDSIIVHTNPAYRGAVDSLIAQSEKLVYIELKHSILLSRSDFLANDQSVTEVSLTINHNKAVFEKPILVDTRVLRGPLTGNAWDFVDKLSVARYTCELSVEVARKQSRFLRAISEADMKINRKFTEFACMQDFPNRKSLSDGTEILTVFVRRICKQKKHSSSNKRSYYK